MMGCASYAQTSTTTKKVVAKTKVVTKTTNTSGKKPMPPLLFQQVLKISYF